VPGEQALFADALAIYDAIAVRPGVDRKRIVAMGRSLGSGVATYLASQRGPVTAVIIERADHNDIASHPRYWPAVREFLRK